MTMFAVTTMVLTVSASALFVVGVLTVSVVVAVEGMFEPATTAEWHATNGRRVDLWRVFSIALFVGYTSRIIASRTMLRSCLLVEWWWWRWALLAVLSEERMIFHVGDEVPEGIRWWVEIIDGRHDCECLPLMR